MPASFWDRLKRATRDSSLAYVLFFVGAFVASFEGDPIQVARIVVACAVVLPVCVAAFVDLTPEQRRARRLSLITAPICAALIVAVTLVGGTAAGAMALVIALAAYVGGRHSL
jgi:hypothetical protein